MWRGESAINQVVRRGQGDEVLVKLLSLGPANVYAGLLAYAIERGYKPGWAGYAFKEIFGAWPRSQDRREPQKLPDFLVEEWAARRKRKPDRIKLEKPAPLFDVVEAPESQRIDSNGFTPGTLMTPEDWEVDL